MNDFTKEELIKLLNWRNEVKYTKKPTSQMIASNERLGEKIQSMIDNYCEHETIIPKLETVCRCSKCNNVVECIPI